MKFCVIGKDKGKQQHIHFCYEGLVIYDTIRAWPEHLVTKLKGPIGCQDPYSGYRIMPEA